MNENDEFDLQTNLVMVKLKIYFTNEILFRKYFPGAQIKEPISSVYEYEVETYNIQYYYDLFIREDWVKQINIWK